MLCARCSHPLSPRKGRCLRCFALNPEDRPAPVSRRVHDSGPASPLRVSIKSDPPQMPLAFSFDDEQAPAAAPAAAITDPELEPELEPRTAAAWLSDSFFVAALSLGSLFACAAAAVKLGQVRYPLDFLRDTSILWLVLFGLLSLAWSAFFTLRRAAVD